MECELDNSYLKRRDAVQTDSLWSHKQKAPAHRQKAKSPGLHAGVSSSTQHTFTLLLLDWEEREGRAAQSHAYPTFMNVYELPSME